MNRLSKEINNIDPSTFNSLRAKYAPTKRKDRNQAISTAPTLEEEILNVLKESTKPKR